MVKRFAADAAATAAAASCADWRRVLAGANQAMCVIVLHGAAEALGGRWEALQGHGVLRVLGRVDHHSVRVFLGKGLLVGVHQAQGRLPEAGEPALS